jgi:ABC-type branched-subunit amino acid transport system substrate-binding protein
MRGVNVRPAPPRRPRTFTTVAASSAALMLLTSGCAARFARTESAGGSSQQLSQDGLTPDQTGATPSQGPVSSLPRAGGTTGGTTGGTAGGTTGGTTGGTAGGTSGSTSGTGGATSGTGGATAGTSGTSASTAETDPLSASRGSTVGVTDTTVKIGLFVPKTGAAPVPPTIDAQAQNYWDYVKSKAGGIHGRNVTVTIYDTGSTEQGARTAVQSAVNDGIFAAISLDRISVEGALVTELHKAGIPHLINQMPHAQKIPDDGFYIGTDQVNNGRQIANYMAHTLKVQTVGFVGETDSTAYPARDAFVAEAKKLGLKVVHNEVVNGMDSQFLSEAQKLAKDNAQAVWMYVAPNNAINISKESQADGYHPTWVSSSIAWGFNLALAPAAGALDGAKSFSPWGGLTDPRYETFNQVNTQGKTTQDKDIGLPAWGYGQVIAAAMKASGPKLGRNNFRVALQNLKTGAVDVVTGAPMCWPPLDFTGSKRYGSGDRTIVMSVKGNGATGSSQWVTDSDYASVY